MSWSTVGRAGRANWNSSRTTQVEKSTGELRRLVRILGTACRRVRGMPLAQVLGDEAGREPFQRREVEVSGELAGEAAVRLTEEICPRWCACGRRSSCPGSIVLWFPGPLSRPGHDPRFPWPGRTATRPRGRPAPRPSVLSRRNDGAGGRASPWANGNDHGGTDFLGWRKGAP